MTENEDCDRAGPKAKHEGAFVLSYYHPVPRGLNVSKGSYQKTPEHREKLAAATRAWWKVHPEKRGHGLYLRCQTCGNDFATSPSRKGRRKYCSRACKIVFAITTFEDRFWQRVDKTETCWNWKGYRRGGIYGCVKRLGEQITAHRVSLEL